MLLKKIRVTWQQYCSFLIGLGIVLFVWHNPFQPLHDIIFLPHAGIMLIVAAIGICFYKTGEKFWNLGEKKIWIPLTVITISISASGIEQFIEGRGTIEVVGTAVAISVMLFGLYLTVRQVGNSIFRGMALVCIIETISIVWYGVVHQWRPNGGLLSPTNYDIAIGLLIFGLIVSHTRKQYWLSGVCIIGIYFSGAAEGLFVLAGLGIWWLIRNWKTEKKHVLVTSGVACLVILAIIPFTWHNIWDAKLIERIVAFGHQDYYFASGFRAGGGNWHLSPIKLFGYGINLTQFYVGIPHNIVLIIIEQVGIGAMLAWLAVWWYGMKKTWNSYLKYAWVGFILMGVFDHFIWTQAAPWFWCLAGVSSLVNNKGEVVNAQLQDS